MQLPAKYVIDCKINKLMSRYSFQLVKYVFPNKDEHKLVTHFKDIEKDSEHHDYEDIERYAQYMKGLVIQLSERKGSQVQVIDEVVLEGCFDAVIKFSNSGRLFCLMNKSDSQLKIFEINNTEDPHELIREIREA